GAEITAAVGGFSLLVKSFRQGFRVGLIADHYGFSGDDALQAAGVGAVDYRDYGDLVNVAQSYVQGEIGIEIWESLFGEDGFQRGVGVVLVQVILEEVASDGGPASGDHLHQENFFRRMTDAVGGLVDGVVRIEDRSG